MTDRKKKYWLPADKTRNIVPVSLKFLLDRLWATWVLEPADGEPPWVLTHRGAVVAEFAGLDEAQAARKLLFGR